MKFWKCLLKQNYWSLDNFASSLVVFAQWFYGEFDWLRYRLPLRGWLLAVYVYSPSMNGNIMQKAMAMCFLRFVFDFDPNKLLDVSHDMKNHILIHPLACMASASTPLSLSAPCFYVQQVFCCW